MTVPSFNIHHVLIYWLSISYLRLDVKLNFYYLETTLPEASHKTLGNPESIIVVYTNKLIGPKKESLCLGNMAKRIG